MGFWNKIFGKSDQQKVGGMEDFMTLIRVYFQAAMAADLGITNLAALPDLRVFKATLKVPTVNNKLGVGERSRCKKMLKEMYGMDDDFFKEIDQSLRKRCKKIQDAQTYLLQFQGFTQDIMMLTGNLMKFKLRLPGFMKKALYTMTEKYNYRLTDKAKEKAEEKIRKMEAEKGPHFANARDVRNLFEKIVTNQATRLAELPDADIREITEADICLV